MSQLWLRTLLLCMQRGFMHKSEICEINQLLDSAQMQAVNVLCDAHGWMARLSWTCMIAHDSQASHHGLGKLLCQAAFMHQNGHCIALSAGFLVPTCQRCRHCQALISLLRLCLFVVQFSHQAIEVGSQIVGAKALCLQAHFVRSLALARQHSLCRRFETVVHDGGIFTLGDLQYFRGLQTGQMMLRMMATLGQSSLKSLPSAH